MSSCSRLNYFLAGDKPTCALFALATATGNFPNKSLSVSMSHQSEDDVEQKH